MREILLLWLIAPLFFVPSAHGAYSTERINSIPDITQTDPRAGFPHGGIHYCGPCAISNSIFWLGENGYENLLPRLERGKDLQAELTRILASSEYMDTTLEWGTSPAGILRGISRYIRDCGYEYSQLAYQGWREVPAGFDTGIEPPQLEWIISGLEGDAAVWLNVGWYVWASEKNEYKRVGGHWVTLVGFGIDGDGNLDPSVLIVHDPGARSGYVFSNDYAKLERIESGRMVGGGGSARNAAGYFRIKGGMKIQSGADAGILDGAIRLVMKRNVLSADRRMEIRSGSTRQ